MAQPRGKLGVILNPRSGRHKPRLARAAPPGDIPVVEASTHAEIGRAVEFMAGQGVDLLAVAGGDGTVQAVLTELFLGNAFTETPLLALIPTGSTNMTGSDVGTVDIRRCGWQKLRDWAAGPDQTGRHVVDRPVLRIQPGATNPAFCGMFFGAGAIVHAVQYTQRDLHGVGLRGDVGPGVAFTRFVKAVGTGDRRYFSPVHMRLCDDDGQRMDQKNLLFLASTLDRLVMRFRPFWGQQDAPLAWTAVADDARGLLYRLPAVARGMRWRGVTPANGYTSRNAWRLSLDFDGGYIVDGEFFDASTQAGPVTLDIAGTASFLCL